MISFALHLLAAAAVFGVPAAGVYLAYFCQQSRTRDRLTAFHSAVARKVLREGRWVRADEIDRHDIDISQVYRN